VPEVEVLIISSFSRHLEFFPNPQVLLETYSSKDPKLILAVPASFSHGPSRSLFADFAAVPDNVILLTGRGEEGTLGRILFERWNKSQRTEDKWDKGKLGSSVMLDGSLDLRVGLRFYSAFVMCMLIFSKAKLKSPSGGCRTRDLSTKAATRARESCRSAGSACA
jgi:hypothetical protein